MKQHFNKAFTITASIIGALIIGVSGDRISNLLFGTEDTEKQTVQKTEVLAKNSRIDNQVLKRIELMVQSINSNNEVAANNLPSCNQNSQKSKCNGTIDNNFILYVGEILNNLANGAGLMTFKYSKSTRAGAFKEGLSSGYAIEQNELGKVLYAGEWKNDLYHGEGALYGYNPNTSYIGQFKNGLQHGIGKSIGPEGSISEGEWHKNQLHGYGSFFFPNGEGYVGNYLHGQKHGSGFYKFQASDTYKGNFKNDLIHGYGEYTFANGEISIGNFRLGQKHGKNKTVYSNKKSTECDNYYYGLMNGECITRYTATYYVIENYVKGLKQGISITQRSGQKETGNYKDNLLHGEKILEYTLLGDIEVQNYSNGILEGQTTYTFASGIVQITNYKDGRKHGDFTISYVDGNKMTCEYDKGEQLGCVME